MLLLPWVAIMEHIWKRRNCLMTDEEGLNHAYAIDLPDDDDIED